MSSIRTLLFSDIEGSTELLRNAGDRYADLLQCHRDIVRAAVRDADGMEHGTEGDSFFVSFDSPSSALAAAVQAQRQLEAFAWPEGLRFRVRIGLHLGEVAEHDGGLVGLAVHHAARIAAAAHGGQIVVSDAVRLMVGVLPDDSSLRKLGERRLRDVGIVTLYQVLHPDLQDEFPELRGLIGTRTNLPRTATEMVGGEALLESIGELIADTRVVTLIGTGGVGKTRAALEFAWRSLDQFEDGTLFVDLAPISDAAAVSAAVAATMPMVSPGGVSLVDGIVDWVAGRRLLLLIDNCEHLLDEVFQIVSAVVAGCEHVKILATSREALGVAGERALRVPSLDATDDAVELFCQRARAADSSFERSGDEVVLVQICERLDGIPLAIELAAARMSSTSPDELLARLRDRFRLLHGSKRGTLERQQTLLATVSWSYQLLSDDERLIFDSLSVFAGGFDTRAAEAVCTTESIDELEIIDIIHSLVDKSMVIAEHTTTGTRFRLLETLRQFGEEQLERRTDTTVLRDRHAAHSATRVKELDLLVRGSHQVEACSAVALEWDNSRAAHQWALGRRDFALAECFVEGTFTYAYGQIVLEHADWTQRTIELGESVGKPSTLMLGMHSHWRMIQGDDAGSVRAAGRGIEVAPSPDHPSTCWCWWALCGASPLWSSNSAAVRDAYQHLQTAVANVDDPDIDWWPLVILSDASMIYGPGSSDAYVRQLGEIADRIHAPQLFCHLQQQRGLAMLGQPSPDYEGADLCYEQMLSCARSSGDGRAAALSLRGMAIVATGMGREDALASCHDALEANYDIRYWLKIWQVLDSVVLALARSHQFEEAAVILGHLEAHRPAFGVENKLGFRLTAAKLIGATGDHSTTRERGALMNDDEIVAAALNSCTLPRVS